MPELILEREVKTTLMLRESTNDWLEARSSRNKRCKMREAETIIEAERERELAAASIMGGGGDDR